MSSSPRFFERIVTSRRGYITAAVVLLAIHAIVAIDCARRWTVTHDEYWHLPAGLAVWKQGRFDADNLNPPLTRAWAALPLCFSSAQVDADVPANDAVALGDRFLQQNRERYDALYFAARVMNVVLSVLVGVIVGLWTRDLFGPNAALLAVAFWSFCPVAVSNAPLVTPDMGATLLFVATLYACWRHARQPTWQRAVLLGLLLGLAQLTKFTSVLLYPLCFVNWFLARRSLLAGSPSMTGRRGCAQVMTVLAVSLVTLNAGYGFQGSFRPFSSHEFRSAELQSAVKLSGPLARLPALLPFDYLEGLDRQRAIMQEKHPVFLDGTWDFDGNGFLTYYARALAYKVPHVTQALFLLALVAWVAPLFMASIETAVKTDRDSLVSRAEWPLIIPAATLVFIASLMSMQLGIRYILPVLPLLYVFTGRLGKWLDWYASRGKCILLTGCLLLLPLSLRYHPHHLAYFNELVGGPLGGRKHLLDSNLDWGQDLKELKRYLDDHDIGEINLAYFGMFLPAELGIKYQLPPFWFHDLWVRDRPPIGWHAVSANFVMGRPHTLRTPDGTLRRAGPNEFQYFSHVQPVARIGYTIDVYHIEAGVPVVPAQAQ